MQKKNYSSTNQYVPIFFQVFSHGREQQIGSARMSELSFHKKAPDIIWIDKFISNNKKGEQCEEIIF